MYEIYKNSVQIGALPANPTNNPSMVIQKQDGTVVSWWIYKKVDENYYFYTNAGEWQKVNSLPSGVKVIIDIVSPTTEIKRAQGAIAVTDGGTIPIDDKYKSRYTIYVAATGANNNGPATPAVLMVGIRNIDDGWLSTAIYGMYIFPGIYSVEEQGVNQTIMPIGSGYGGTILTIDTYVIQTIGLLALIFYLLDLVKVYRNGDVRSGLMLLLYEFIAYILTGSLAIATASMLPNIIDYYDLGVLRPAAGFIGMVISAVGLLMLTVETALAYLVAEAEAAFSTGVEYTTFGAALSQSGYQTLSNVNILNLGSLGEGIGLMTAGIYYAMISMMFYGLAAGTMAVAAGVVALQLVLGWGLVLLGYYIGSSTVRQQVNKATIETINAATALGILAT
ncbi:MAG: hypothetical protein [aquatic viral metagenome]